MLNKLKGAYDTYKSIFHEELETVDQIEAEFQVWSTYWKQDKDLPETAIAALNKCSERAFPVIHKLLKILTTLPVSTAEAEREFSKVNRTLTLLRSTMSEERLEALVLIETYRSQLPDTSTIVEKFRLCKQRKANFNLNV